MPGHIYLAPFEWAEYAPGEFGWQAQGGDALGLLDFRNLTEMSQPGGNPEGLGLFVYDSPRTLQDGYYLGSDPEKILTPQDKAAFRRFLSGNVVADSLLTSLQELYLVHADDTGEGAFRPLRISRRLGFQLYLGGFGFLIQDQFRPSHPAFNRTLAVRLADYRRERVRIQVALDSSNPREVEIGQRRLSALKRDTGQQMQRLFGRMGDDLLEALVPAEWISDGWLPPQTTLTDTFTETADTNLESHTSTGGTPSFGWEMVLGGAGSFYVHGGTDQVRSAAVEGPILYRTSASGALSGDAHYNQANISVVGTGGTQRFATVATRMSASVSDWYQIGLDYVEQSLRIARAVGGTVTTIAGPQAYTLTIGTNYLVRLESNEVDLHTSFVDGIEEISVTDTALTGNVRVGFRARHNALIATQYVSFDNMTAEDLGGAPPTGPGVVQAFMPTAIITAPAPTVSIQTGGIRLLQKKTTEAQEDSFSIAVTLDSSPSAGNLLVAGIAVPGATSVSDVEFPTGWLEANSQLNGMATRLMYKVAGVDEPAGIVVNLPSPPSAPSLFVAEYAGINPLHPLKYSVGTHSGFNVRNWNFTGELPVEEYNGDLVVGMVGILRGEGSPTHSFFWTHLTHQDDLHPSGTAIGDLAWGSSILSGTPMLEITNMVIASEQPYLSLSGLDNGLLAYIDSALLFNNVPTQLLGQSYIRTANGDNLLTTDPLITFWINITSDIIVTRDNTLSGQQLWQTNYAVPFANTGLSLNVGTDGFTVYSKSFGPGKVTLGGNEGNANSIMYNAIISPTDVTNFSATGVGWVVGYRSAGISAVFNRGGEGFEDSFDVDRIEREYGRGASRGTFRGFS